MGLDFIGSDAHFSYSGFHAFRQKVASSVGINLSKMYGFQAMNKSNDGQIPWDGVKDDIKIFLNHSDCEGILTPTECKKAGKRLKEIVSTWEDGDWDKENGLQLAKDMLKCAKVGMNLEFC